MRPRLQSGAIARPLSFTVSGHMLGWRDLTRKQRVGAVFLLVIFIMASPFLVFVAPTSSGDRMWYAGLMSIYLGVILDPQWYRLQHGTLASVAAMPPVCRILSGVGLALAGTGFVMQHWLGGNA